MKRGFIELPYLPRDLVGLVLVDKRISQDAYKRLKKLYINIIKTVICSELYDAVCCHPDMVVTPMGGRLIVVAPNVVGYYGPIFRRLGFDVIEGRTFLERNYPWNIAYNVCRVGNFLIHNLKYTDESILKIAQEKKLKKISVPQAYSKC